MPQALVYLGVLEYSDALLQRLRTDPNIPSQDRIEIEIRGCSIWAVEVHSKSQSDNLPSYSHQSKTQI